jgi:hypothetical protein
MQKQTNWVADLNPLTEVVEGDGSVKTIPQTTSDAHRLRGGVEVDGKGRNIFVAPEPTPFAVAHPLAANPIQLSPSQIEDLRRRIQITGLGENELSLALTRVEADCGNVAGEVRRVIEAYREQFFQGGDSQFIGGIFKSTSEWNRIYAESEKAARATLLGKSSTVSNLDELQAAAKKATEAVSTAELELNIAWKEFQSLPAKAEPIQQRLEAIASERSRNNLPVLQAEYRKAYGHWYLTGQVVAIDLNKLVSDIVLAPLRIAALNEIEPKVLAKLDAIRKRSKELAKRLNTKPQDL